MIQSDRGLVKRMLQLLISPLYLSMILIAWGITDNTSTDEHNHLLMMMIRCQTSPG